MLGGRFFWFITGIAAGFCGNIWLRRRLRRLNVSSQIASRFKNITREVKSALTEGREAMRKFERDISGHERNGH